MNNPSFHACVWVVLLGCGGTTGPGIDGGNDGTISDGSSGDAPLPCLADGAVCQFPLSCCNAACVYEVNDPLNCGGCGTKCNGATPMCENNKCQAETCDGGCTATQECCDVPGPGPSQPPKCYDGNTCPIGCPLCQ